MERSEPTFVPEWLKGTSGNVNGGGSGSGTTTHHFTSSSHSDDHGVALHSRNRSLLSFSDYESSRSPSDRTSSSYFRRSSSGNASMLYEKDVSSNSRAYSSFNRSHRDKREKERSLAGDFDSSDISDLTSRIERDILRRSKSMITGSRGEVLPRRVIPASSSNNNHSNHNGVGVSNKSSIGKVMFEKDFPHLGAEEKQEVPDRVSSPCLTSVVQSLPMGIVGNGWTSALAEVPPIIGSNNVGLSSVSQGAPVSSVAMGPNVTTGLNMAETLAQAPSRARTLPQVSVESQRLEELAIKQSRQLIPMTPSMPKNLALASEKQKPKAGGRSDMNVVNKTGQQQQLLSSHPANHSLRGGLVKPDVVKVSHGGKLLVLKSPRDNGILPATMESSRPTNPGRIASNQLAVASSTVNNSKLASVERKSPTLPANLTSSLEKKPTLSQAKSRNDFFNSMRKKSSTNFSSAVQAPPSSATSSNVSQEPGQVSIETTVISPQGSNVSVSDASNLDWPAENGAGLASNGDVDGESQRCPINGEKDSSCDAILYPDEEEAAFLRSLGWEFNPEEGGLTEEEINAFYQEYVKLRPSSMRQQNVLHDVALGSSPSSSDSKSEV